jgi:hypothetical protein
VVAYESGRRSPTVRTFARLLAAGGLQVRGELEPLLADVDELGTACPTAHPRSCREVAPASPTRLRTEPSSGPSTAARRSSCPGWPAKRSTRRSPQWLLRGVEARPADKDGMPLFDSWLSLDMTALGTQSMSSAAAGCGPGVVPFEHERGHR